MNFLNIDQCTEETLQALVDNSVLEGKTIEYKQALPTDSRVDKVEFLADASSFANASGGVIIYGITEDKNRGVPKAVEGVEIVNVDQEISRLDNMIRTGIDPRIMGKFIMPVRLSNSRVVLVIKIPKSWISPHRVTYDGHDKFYSRSSNGKYPLDVSELRVAFNLSETVAERIRRFKEDRISKIFANEPPISFYDSAKIVLHLIPFESLSPSQTFDLNKIASQYSLLEPICTGISGYRYNLDGFLTYSQGRENRAISYVQLFKNGIIEAVDGALLSPREDELTIPSVAYEEHLMKSLKSYFSVLTALNIEPPIICFLTLIGAKGYTMAVDVGIHEGRPVDRDVLILPEVVIESYDANLDTILKPCFDSLWNACDFPKSLNYDDEGRWSPPKISPMQRMLIEGERKALAQFKKNVP